ncbi:MAG: membrane protein insertase YidC, partial [Alphaproteobacteria bacterium]|nr:membrane protein insertase YidC [Alphaproteobacteria bacterium]
MNDQKNMILAIVLSAIVLFGWNYFFGIPQMQKQREQQQQQQTQQTTPPAPNATPGSTPSTAPAAPGTAPTAGQPGAAPQVGGATAQGGQILSRETALAASPRVAIDTPALKGTIALKGARIDDLSLVQYRETVDPTSPAIVLLAPSGTEHPFYAEFGWAPAGGSTVKVPGPDTVWQQEGSGTLAVGKPVTLVWDNGEGLQFRRTISVDDKYVFTGRDEVVNKSGSPVTLAPWALISRHGTPPTSGYYILHEGLIGVLGEKGEQTETYKKIDDIKPVDGRREILFPNVTNGWLGFTDKYWAAALLPDTKATLNARFSGGMIGNLKTYQTDYLLGPQTIAPGASAAADFRLFAGAKEVATIDAYDKAFGLNRFELIIDWGIFYFITKPMFKAIDFFYHQVGNFGFAILLVTLLIKILFLPLANKSYASMAKMKAVQPEMTAIRERFADDKMKQQQALMDLYKKEKINPLAGCLPIAIQIPVFFSLYKVLFITIEMRHAPFIGWIRDLSAPDPTNLFTAFGLINWDPTVLPLLGPYLHLGFWPLIMG